MRTLVCARGTFCVCGPGAAALPEAEKKDKRNALPSMELKYCNIHMGNLIWNVITSSRTYVEICSEGVWNLPSFSFCSIKFRNSSVHDADYSLLWMPAFFLTQVWSMTFLNADYFLCPFSSVRFLMPSSIKFWFDANLFVQLSGTIHLVSLKMKEW